MNSMKSVFQEIKLFAVVEKWILSVLDVRNKRRLLVSLPIALLYIAMIPALLWGVPMLADITSTRRFQFAAELEPDPVINIAKLRSDVAALERRLDRLTPGNAYLVVNISENRFYLFRNKNMIREGLCSTGSYISLEGDGDQKWLFKTPRGVFRVQGKIENPVWRRPDWAFVEEGLPVPPPDHHSRFERGVLGDYALTLGDGYMIHGTLYQRLIGQPVTHGCVRMLDDDLYEVFHTLSVGSRVFIY